MHKNGFTLIELLVVVVIIGILAAIALPRYEKSVERSRITEALVHLSAIAQANKRHHLATGNYATSMSELDVSVPGNDVLLNNIVRKEGNYFLYAPSGMNLAAPLATAVRKPYPDYYLLMITSEKPDQIQCYPHSEKGRSICNDIADIATLYTP